MEKKNSTRALWREYFNKKENLYDYIRENTICLRSDETEDPLLDSPGEFLLRKPKKNNRARCIYFTEDEKILNIISKKSKELEDFFNKINNGKRQSLDIPKLFHDVEMININVNDAYESIKIDETNATKLFPIAKEEALKSYWGDDYLKNLKKYELSTYLGFVEIKNENLLKLANAKILQARKLTGKKYMVKIRQKGNNLSSKHRYGFIVVDNKPIINESNKQLMRSHSLELTGNKFECPIPSPYTFFIKK